MARKMVPTSGTIRWAISVSSPDLNLGRATTKPSWCPTSGTFPSPPKEATKFDEEYKFCASSQSDRVKVKLQSGGRTKNYIISNIYVNGDVKTPSNMGDNDHIKTSGAKKEILTFKNLKNGFTTEVWVTF